MTKEKEEVVFNYLDVAEETIRQYLPENMEMDDISWCDTGFSIPVFDVTTPFGKEVDRFRFHIYSWETEEETAVRFNEELNRFCKSF